MMYVYTFYTDEEEISYIKETDLLNNMNVNYIKKDSWNGYTDEINETNNIIKNHNDNDIICFIHAYDVLINQDMSYLTEKFNNYNCDLLIGVELNCSIEKYINMYPNTTSKKKYICSGGYIGYKFAIQDLFNWKSYDDICNICLDGGLKSYFTEYFLSKQSERIKLDNDCLIFQNMYLVSWNELRIHNGKIHNKSLHKYPCFVHFNMGSKKQSNGENIIPIIVDKIKITSNNTIIVDPDPSETFSSTDPSETNIHIPVITRRLELSENLYDYYQYRPPNNFCTISQI